VAVVPGRLLSASWNGASGNGASGDTGGAGEYLRLAFTQAPDVLARSALLLASAAPG
jgi:hypothetical protein